MGGVLGIELGHSKVIVPMLDNMPVLYQTIKECTLSTQQLCHTLL